MEVLGHRPARAPRRTPRARHHARGRHDQRPGHRRRHRRRLLLQRDHPGRLGRGVPVVVHRARQLPDLYIAMVKAAIFGWLAAIVGAYKGLNAGGGPSGVGRRGQRVGDHRVHAAVLPERRHHRDLLPDRPTAGAVMSALTARIYAKRRPPVPRRAAATSCLLHQGGSACDPARDRPLPREILKILAEVTFGAGGARRHRRHRRRHRLPGLLRRRRGRHPGLRLAEPDRHREVHRLRLGLLQHPRGRAAGRRRSPWPPPSAAASPPSSAPCGSPRRSTPSR